MTPPQPRHWYLAKNKQRLGPFTAEQLRKMTATGMIQPADMLLEEGQQKWRQAQEIDGIFPVALPVTNRPYSITETSFSGMVSTNDLCRDTRSWRSLLNSVTVQVILCVLFAASLIGLLLFFVGDGRRVVNDEVTSRDGSVLKRRITYRDGKQDGPTTLWYRNGQIALEMNFKEGHLIKATDYYESGKKCGSTELEWNRVGGAYAASGTTYTWFENEQMETLTQYKDSYLSGSMLAWHSNGQKKFVSTWIPCASINDESPYRGRRGSVQHGVMTVWYDNGQMCARVAFRYGVVLSEEFWDRVGKSLGNDREKLALLADDPVTVLAVHPGFLDGPMLDEHGIER